MIGHVYGHWVTNSYDEVKTFRISAAFWADQSLLLKFKSKGGLIQGISHTFDANLYTQNGLRQTHALASIICQPSSPDDDKMKREDIPRLKKQQLSKIQLSDMEIKTFAGEKKPKMPASLAKFGVLPHKVLCYWIAVQKWANEEDFLFLKYCVIVSSTQEFSGYNTRTTRETGQSLKAKSKVYYCPLINKTLNNVNSNVQFGEDFKGCWSVILNVNMWPAVVPSDAGCNLGKSTAMGWICSMNWWYALDYGFRWECGQIDGK